MAADWPRAAASSSYTRIKERLTNYRVKYCDLLTGGGEGRKMRDSDGNRPPHTFVLRSASFAFHRDPSLPFSRPLRLPRFSFFSLSPSCPNSPPPPDRRPQPTVLYLLTQLKKQSVERPTAGFLLCRCRGPAKRGRQEGSQGKVGFNSMRAEALTEHERDVDAEFTGEHATAWNQLPRFLRSPREHCR